MRACANIGGYATIFLPGASPSFILKSSKSMPRVVGLHGLGVRGMSSFHTEGCERGFIYADSAGVARVSQLLGSSEDGQDDSSGDRIVSIAELGVQLTKIPLGMDATAVAYHPPSKTYVVGCSRPEPYELPKDDDYHREWQREPSGAAFAFKPLVDRGIVRVFSPATWAEIDQLELEPAEVVLALRVLNLEVSETTHERRRLVAIGTAVVQGEDYPIKGRVHVLDVVDVIPEPDRPDTTNRRLKAIVREEMPRGAVTALCGIGTQGLMLVAQGQKCMVRGLKEDGSLLPVAFMDLNCHVTAATELPGTGLCLFADAFKGVWFVGYTEEPYRMILFGKSRTSWEVQAVEFLPDGRDLAIVAADADGGITILEFDPEREFLSSFFCFCSSLRTCGLQPWTLILATLNAVTVQTYLLAASAIK